MLAVFLLIILPLLAVLVFSAYALHLGATEVALGYGRRLNLRVKVPAFGSQSGRRGAM